MQKVQRKLIVKTLMAFQYSPQNVTSLPIFATPVSGTRREIFVSLITAKAKTNERIDAAPFALELIQGGTV
jgi:hypothetical protein